MIKLLIRSHPAERSQKEAKKYVLFCFVLKKGWGVDCWIGTALPQRMDCSSFLDYHYWFSYSTPILVKKALLIPHCLFYVVAFLLEQYIFPLISPLYFQ